MFDVAVVGGGIVGLATARELLLRRPGLELVVLEKERAIGQHQTGHNSGVIHSGLYYTPGSLRARTCVEGVRLMEAFCDEHAISYQRCGKVIVATQERELPGLDELYRRGTVNGVPDLQLIGPERLRELEPQAVGIKALHSPTTAIVDFGAVAAALGEEVHTLGGTILTDHRVADIAPGWVLRTPQIELVARTLVGCAGLHADRVARMTGAAPDPQIVPFRGDYYALRPDRRHLVRGLIYPVPDPALPFLGMHFNRRVDGSVWLGPNAVLAFAREGYRFRQVNLRDSWETLTAPGFWRLARRHALTGATEMYRDLRKHAFMRALQRYMPALEPRDAMRGPAGVRAQAVGRDGKLLDDFLVSRGDGFVHVRNAPSPAATGSLAIARLVADAAGFVS